MISVFLIPVLFASHALALVRFNPGVSVIEGKVIVQDQSTFVVINRGTDSEVRIQLKGKLPVELKSQAGSNAAIRVRFKRSLISISGEAEFVAVERYLDPMDEPKVY